MTDTPDRTDRDPDGEARASRTIHDALFKRVFGDATNAAAELRAVVPARVARHIDWSSLTVAHANVVSERFTQRHGDLLFSARLTDGREAFVWLLFEHQSTVDPWMAVRVAELTLDLWKRWRERNPRARRVPAVLPVVLYHGASPWSAATSLAALTDLSPGAAADWGDHLLSCRFVLDDLRATPDEALAARQLPPYPKLGLVVFKHGPDPALPARLGRYSAELRALLATEDGTALLGVLLEYTWYVNAHVDRDVLIRHLEPLVGPEVERAMKSYAEKLKQEGREQGLAQGQRHALQRLLERRFGPLPDAVIARLAGAGLDELERWLELVLDAGSLDDIFTR